jgi:hypothetical protein
MLGLIRTSKMTDYINTRPLNELIAETTPLPLYEYIAQDIQRDKDYGWSLQYYKDWESTSYDMAICRSEMAIREATKTIAQSNTLMDTLSAEIARAKLDPKHAHYKKMTLKVMEAKQLGVASALDDIAEAERTITNENVALEKFKWGQYVEKWRYRNLRYIRNTYQLNGDFEYVRRGVTWACSYADKLLGDQYEARPVFDTTKDNSAW